MAPTVWQMFVAKDRDILIEKSLTLIEHHYIIIIICLLKLKVQVDTSF